MHFSMAVGAQALTFGDLVKYSLSSTGFVHLRDVVLFSTGIFVVPIEGNRIVLTTDLTKPLAKQVEIPLTTRLTGFLIGFFYSLGIHQASKQSLSAI